jgi:septal ring factor EnvC (AmiA/AmiB activator)
MDEKETIQSEAKPETRLHKSMRSVLRWGLVALLAFGLGALIMYFALYIPTRQQLDKVNANLEQANATVTGQTDQISTLQTGNETLQKDLDSAALHVQVLMALSGVRGASLAVADGDYAGARLSLIQASDALNILSGLLGTDQKDVLTAMQRSATQALTKLKINLSSAQPELDQLANNLVQLENNLFPNP